MTEKDVQIFRKYIPEAAVKYCFELWTSNKFHLKITKPRNSKLGDYCYHPAKGHAITVNSNLNQYSFLITYLHEVAHLHVQKSNFRKKLPHGKEWKDSFRKLLDPVLSTEIFPDDILHALKVYHKNPTASTGSHSLLANTLRHYDQQIEGATILYSLQENDIFELNGRIFAKGQMRRTRYLCKELKSGKNYVILGRAVVQKFESNT
jgi:SprT protein